MHKRHEWHKEDSFVLWKTVTRCLFRASGEQQLSYDGSFNIQIHKEYALSVAFVFLSVREARMNEVFGVSAGSGLPSGGTSQSDRSDVGAG